MNLVGKIKVVKQLQIIGNNGFRKREIVITTNEKYPQHILIEFTQDKCELLNDCVVGQEVKIYMNLRGREWVNSQGESVYFNSFQGWKIESLNNLEIDLSQTESVSFIQDDDTDLPF